MKPRIYIDERERGEIRTMFEKFECEMRVETLPVADYIVGKNTGIERKRGDDLTASICDNRFFKQILNLTDTFKNPILILEDFSRMFDRNIERNAIFGAILYVQYKWNVKVIPTQNSLETARIVWSLSKYYQKDQKLEYEIPKIQPKQVTYQSQLDFLEGFLDVSQKKAKILLKKFKTPGGVIDGIIKSKIEKSASGKTKSVSGPIKEIKGFGPKFVEKNQKLLISQY